MPPAVDVYGNGLAEVQAGRHLEKIGVGLESELRWALLRNVGCSRHYEQHGYHEKEK
jgi:hypothetical protein